MSESNNEWHLLLPVLPFLAVAPYLYSTGWKSVEAAYLIVLVPLLTFPLILILGQMYTCTGHWKHRYQI